MIEWGCWRGKPVEIPKSFWFYLPIGWYHWLQAIILNASDSTERRNGGQAILNCAGLWSMLIIWYNSKTSLEQTVRSNLRFFVPQRRPRSAFSRMSRSFSPCSGVLVPAENEMSGKMLQWSGCDVVGAESTIALPLRLFSAHMYCAY